MSAIHWSGSLALLGAMPEYIAWACGYDTPQDAWDTCDRADWMAWLVGVQSCVRGSDARKRCVAALSAAAGRERCEDRFVKLTLRLVTTAEGGTSAGVAARHLAQYVEPVSFIARLRRHYPTPPAC